MKSLLLSQFASASPDSLKDGVLWYREARKFCKSLARETNTPLVQVVGILSALSPSNKWEQNKKDTRNFVLTGGNCPVCTYGVQKSKALDILHKASTKREVLKILRGPKTVAFFRNIFHYLTAGDVCLDRWALRAVNIDPSSSLSKSVRTSVEEAYKGAAAEVGLRPHEFQAVLWINIKETTPVRRSKDELLKGN